MSAGCGGPVTAPSGEIHSPSYPNSYPNNVDCTWVISVDAQHRVFFNFSDLDIESHSNCSWDYVAVGERFKWYLHLFIVCLDLSSNHLWCNHYVIRTKNLNHAKLTICVFLLNSNQHNYCPFLDLWWRDSFFFSACTCVW